MTDSKHKYLTHEISHPKPEKDKKQKKYKSVDPCPMCNNSDSDKITKLHGGFCQCICGCEWDSETGMIRIK